MRSLITIIVLFLPALSFGQSGDGLTATININAQVTPVIELVTINSMTFGNSDADENELYVNPITDLNAGFMIALGTPEAEFRLDFLRARELTNTTGEGTLTFTYELSGNSIEDQTTSELIEERNQNIFFNNEGRYYIWVGGRVNLEQAVPGTYEGDFTIEIDYI